MSPAQASHELDSLTPAEQIECEQVLPPPPHEWPQTVPTSLTQIESHAVLQQ